MHRMCGERGYGSRVYALRVASGGNVPGGNWGPPLAGSCQGTRDRSHHVFCCFLGVGMSLLWTMIEGKWGWCRFPCPPHCKVRTLDRERRAVFQHGGMGWEIEGEKWG